MSNLALTLKGRGMKPTHFIVVLAVAMILLFCQQTPHRCDNTFIYCWSGPLNTDTLLGAAISYLNRH